MKNYLLYFFLFCFTLEQSCTPSILKKVKVTRTVTKEISLKYSVNQVGNFQTYQLISSRDIINAFDEENTNVSSATIDRIDIQGVKIGADVLANNTATQVVLSADVLSGALLDKVTSLLNKTKTIIITKDKGFDFKNALDNVVDGIQSDDETDKENAGETKLYNALTILNATGASELKKILAENLGNINRGGLSIRLNGTVPNNQRLVMNLTIQINASITFTRCESIVVSGEMSTEDECI